MSFLWAISSVDVSTRQHTGLATAIGVVAVVALLQVLGVVPVVGDFVAAAILVTGLGAVVLTYFGLQRFEPAFPGYE